MNKEEIRLAAEADLLFFISLVAPTQVLGNCHKDVIRWWEREDAKSHQLLLFPRDHQKSRLIAYRTAWRLTKDPTLRILYISATANLAEKQLSFIKGILSSDIYRTYWPLHVHPEEGKRAKWTEREISLDHPERKRENVRDPSIFTAGLTTTITGMHCDIAVLDDVVINENAYSPDGRSKVQSQYSLLSSIESGEAEEWAVGTLYHPKDLYRDLSSMTELLYDKDGELIGEEPIYEVYQKPVEDVGDGSGQFLWPRQRRDDGKWFGFDRKILERKRGQYLDKIQFTSQYYNRTNDPDSRPIDYDKFQYYDPKFLKQNDGHWEFSGKRLNIIASIDFAYSTRIKADFSSIVVLGVNEDNDYYVLAIERFKTDKISEYFKKILEMYNKWGFRKLCAEVTAAQKAIVEALKQDYIARHGLAIKVIDVKPTRHQGTKEERMEAILTPRYENMQVYHFNGGYSQILEEELTQRNPPHDDVKDALATAMENIVRPSKRHSSNRTEPKVVYHPRFGGRAF